MNQKISIVIPSYNAGQTLETCIKSIQNTNYDNLEILIVNDGSTDNSAEIIENLQSTDSRIKHIYQDNAGVSSARNNGIDHATRRLHWIC